MTIGRRGTLRLLLLGGALLAGLGLLALGGALAEGAAYLLPVAALITLLLGGYPGERALLAIARPDTASTARRRPPRAARPRAIGVLLPRGGSLLGSPIAVRPPPRAT